MISLSEEIEAFPAVRLVAIGGFAVVGGVGFGPNEARRVGAGSPSETDARGRAVVDVVDLAVPVDPAGEITDLLAASGVGTLLVEVELDKVGFGGSDGLRLTEGFAAGTAGAFAEGLVDAIGGLLAVVVDLVAGTLADVVGLAVAGAALVVFLRAPGAEGFEVVVVVLVALDIAGGEGFTDPDPKVPELMILTISRRCVNNWVNSVIENTRTTHLFNDRSRSCRGLTSLAYWCCLARCSGLRGCLRSITCWLLGLAVRRRFLRVFRHAWHACISSSSSSISIAFDRGILYHGDILAFPFMSAIVRIRKLWLVAAFSLQFGHFCRFCAKNCNSQLVFLDILDLGDNDRLFDVGHGCKRVVRLR